ncbi:hypothetical protein SARC_09693 [Sphaeroforma arctica JP610]|uniref:Uncharacterized protein n=1 Tax=Sphaeroforma arctica JP610 TaxID=667725 RepID=A0A0L0FM58_9EUKA|nr:hypothetical protein SARC_09693 [Sphaeroforma arctica JP610]KNC77862.1 hypothetical protein SARC_09693 [Sphaeroforma arctica JP610]|eukprot:XP_014151764.1 hypothetical protein SARC_09693 [Sphaeroforma arctica JP610]
MVFVDDLAERYPHITHAPWNGLTLADLVMPCFLFMVGCSMAFSLKQYIYTDAQMHGPTLAKYNTYSYWRNYALRIDGTKHALYRAFKLFGLGLILQGGEEFSDNSYYYGWNLRTLRWCGILNRIAFAYLVAVLLELWLPYTDPSALRSRASSVVSRAPSSNYRTTPANENAPLLDHGASDNGAGEERKFGRLKIAANQMRGSLGRHLAVFRMGVWQWVGAVVAVCVHLLLTYLTWVPTWESHYRWDATGALEFLDGSRDAPTVTIECDVRGSTLSPECSAQGFYDRLLFGQDHLHNWRSVGKPMSHYIWRSVEGSLSSIACIATVLIGLHYGKVVTANKLHSADGLTNKYV